MVARGCGSASWVYFAYGYRKSHLGQGRVEVHEGELEPAAPIHD